VNYACQVCHDEQPEAPPSWRWLWAGAQSGHKTGAIVVCGDCPDPPGTFPEDHCVGET
jgi:hypothetical protein